MREARSDARLLMPDPERAPTAFNSASILKLVSIARSNLVR